MEGARVSKSECLATPTNRILHINPIMGKDIVKSSLYGYLFGDGGMCRFKVPDFDDHHQHHHHHQQHYHHHHHQHHHHHHHHQYDKLKIEPVFVCDPERLPMNVGVFSSGHNVYMVGGSSDETTPVYDLYVFDPTTQGKQPFPVQDLSFLDKPINFPPNSKFKSLVDPIVIQPINKNQIYFLTQYYSPWLDSLNFRHMSFQSFDPTNNTFHTLPSPPYRRSTSTDHFREVGCFLAGNYIYLFIQDHLVSYIWHHNSCRHTRAFSFNTLSSEWKEIEETVPAFRKREIPIPFFHRVHAGLSQEFPDKTRIMVATCNSHPIAYCVHIGENGSLSPKSYRSLLHRNFILKDGCTSQLHDIGSGRFLVFFQSDSIPIMLYVFQIDYQLEHQLQNPAKYPKSPEIRGSSKLLWSKQIMNDIPSFGDPDFYAYCLASAPASQSSANQTAAAEDQDRKALMDNRTEVCSLKRKREQLEIERRIRKGWTRELAKKSFDTSISVSFLPLEFVPTECKVLRDPLLKEIL